MQTLVGEQRNHTENNHCYCNKEKFVIKFYNHLMHKHKLVYYFLEN